MGEKFRYVMKSRDIDRIGSAVTLCPELVLEEIEEVYEEARDLHKHLTSISEFKHDIMSLNNRYFSVLRSYKKPPQVIADVIKACYILFGFKETEINTYEKLARLLQKLSNESFKNRVRNFKASPELTNRAVRARKLIDHHEDQLVHDVHGK